MEYASKLQAFELDEKWSVAMAHIRTGLSRVLEAGHAFWRLSVAELAERIAPMDIDLQARPPALLQARTRACARMRLNAPPPIPLLPWA